jgi:hypothetical protein
MRNPLQQTHFGRPLIHTFLGMGILAPTKKSAAARRNGQSEKPCHTFYLIYSMERRNETRREPSSRKARWRDIPEGRRGVTLHLLLKAKVVVSDMQNPEQKKVCALVVQNFENWLVAIGHRSKLRDG